MQIVKTALPGVLVLRPRRHEDNRGAFAETYNKRRLEAAGLSYTFVQDNQSLSTDAGTVRGLHFQAPPAAQAKLVRVVAGAILDVAVDIRYGSPTFGRWIAEELSAENGAQLLIPRGFLHGFVTLQPNTAVLYKVDAHYAPVCEGSVRFDDPDLGIDWGLDPASAVLSDKDAAAGRFSDLQSPFQMDEDGCIVSA